MYWLGMARTTVFVSIFQFSWQPAKMQFVLHTHTQTEVPMQMQDTKYMKPLQSARQLTLLSFWQLWHTCEHLQIISPHECVSVCVPNTWIRISESLRLLGHFRCCKFLTNSKSQWAAISSSSLHLTQLFSPTFILFGWRTANCALQLPFRVAALAQVWLAEIPNTCSSRVFF